MWKTTLGVGFILSLAIEYVAVTQLAAQIGWPFTLFFMLLCIPWGLYLQFSEGQSIRLQLVESMAKGRPISDLLAQGALLLLGSVLMIIPGVVNSLVGLVCVLPPSRRLLSPLALKVVNTRFIPPVITSTSGPQTARTQPSSGVNMGGVPRPSGYQPGATQAVQGPGSRGVQGSGPANRQPRGRVHNPNAPRKQIQAEVVHIERTQPEDKS